MPPVGHNHFTSYNRRRILNNDVPPITVKRIEDQLPVVVTLGEKTNNTDNSNVNPCCAVMNRQLSLATTREEKHVEEIERLKSKLKTKSKRYKEKLQETALQHQSQLDAKDQEIERLKAELEAAKKSKDQDGSKKQSAAAAKEDRRRRTSRRSSWSERSLRRQSSASNNNNKRSNSSVRGGLRSLTVLQPGMMVRRSFSVGGQKPSKSDLQ